MRKLLVCFLFAFSVQATFMERAKNATQGVLDAILSHPFVLQVANGTLPKSKFAYYLMQDHLYDWRYSNAMLLLASKLQHVDTREFLIRGAHDATLHWQGPPATSMQQCLDCQAYSNFEMQSIDSSLHEGLAALAPCYVVYWDVGQWLKNNSVVNNTYQDWIDHNSSPHYQAHVLEFEEHINAIASNVTEKEQQAMLDTYLRSSQFEWHFWDSAYHEEIWIPQ